MLYTIIDISDTPKEFLNKINGITIKTKGGKIPLFSTYEKAHDHILHEYSEIKRYPAHNITVSPIAIERGHMYYSVTKTVGDESETLEFEYVIFELIPAMARPSELMSPIMEKLDKYVEDLK